jgi:hypothetical protein
MATYIRKIQNHSALGQGSASYSSWNKFSMPPAFIIKILLQCSHSFVYVLSMAAFSLEQELGSCDRDLKVYNI